MRAIKPYAKIMEGDIDVLKKIELVGRTCYKSTDLIKDGSAARFVSNLIKNGHEAMLEHASFCFEINYTTYRVMMDTIETLSTKSGFRSFMRFTNGRRILVSGNVRTWRDYFRHLVTCYQLPSCFKDLIQNNPVLFPEWQSDDLFETYNIGEMKPVHADDLKNDLEVYVHNDVTVRFIVDRGISHEIVRHRPASFAQESTRYCNYAKDKFGSQITFIIPEFFNEGSEELNYWLKCMEQTEKLYLKLMKNGVTPEKARSILPHSLKTELIMTANCMEWYHFFDLRACNKTGKAHPQMLEVSVPLLNEFKEKVPVVFDGLTY